MHVKLSYKTVCKSIVQANYIKAQTITIVLCLSVAVHAHKVRSFIEFPCIFAMENVEGSLPALLLFYFSNIHGGADGLFCFARLIQPCLAARLHC